MKRRIIFLLLLSLILSLLLPISVSSAQGPAVYVRKHISILYDNSGSMRMRLEEGPNLRWCYASYAAQMFAGLLNDNDTLDVTFMEGKALDSLDMSKNRQDVLDTILDRTDEANAATPLSKVDTALEHLEREGLTKGQGTTSPGEQYWLVLTTDGQFQDDNEKDKTDKDVVDKLCSIMADYPDLHVVYFGIGTMSNASGSTDNKNKSNSAKDFRESSTNVDASLLKQLHSHNNFTAVYAETQEQIISTMRSLSNQISGRYTVPNQAEVSGNEVRLYLNAEGSPIRNIALMAQETNARLLSATAEDGTPLTLSRDGQIRFPQNSAYNNVDKNTLGGYVALITDPSGKKIPNGTVTLTFSEPIPQENLVLMYEPAIYLHLDVERNTGNGQWVPLNESDKLLEGDQIRVKYAICEDGTDRVLDPNELFGETIFQCLFNGQEFSEDEVLTVSQGDITLEIRASMMDGGYTINVIRNYRVSEPGMEDYTIQSTGPIELRRKDVAENTEKYIEFSLLFRDQPATEEVASKLSVRAEGDAGRLEGTVDKPASHIIRFTPKDADCVAEEYTLSLYHEKTVLATERITVLPNETTYSAVAGNSISIMSNRVADNTDSVGFTVTAHRDRGDGPITSEESALFTVKAGNGTELKGHTTWTEGGQLLFTMQDPSAVPGTYPVSLWLEDEKLAETSVTVIHYDASYTVQVIVSDPNTVDRFDLLENTSNVTFLVLEDGIPCPSAQLEAMLDREIQISTDFNSRYGRLDIRVDHFEGKPAIICTPASTTNSRLIYFFHKLAISTGLTGLNAPELQVELRVDMPKGDSASGTLDLVGIGTAYLVTLLVILGLLLLIFLFFFMNGKSRRLKKGTVWSFTLSPDADGSGRYTACKIGSSAIGDGWYCVIVAPRNEEHKMACANGTVIFKAEPQKTKGGARIAAPKKDRSLFGWHRQNPMVYVKAEDTQNYFYCDVNDGASSKLTRDILNGIKGGSVYSIEDEDGNGLDPRHVLFASSLSFERPIAEDGSSHASSESETAFLTENTDKTTGKKQGTWLEAASNVNCVSGQIKNSLGMVYYMSQDRSGSNYTVIVYDTYKERSKPKGAGIKRPTKKPKNGKRTSKAKAPRKGR